MKIYNLQYIQNASLSCLCIIVLGILQTAALAADSTAESGSLTVRTTPVTEVYEAMGTIRPLTESAIHSQITAKVTAVLVSAGDRVKPGELLIRLDDREVITKLEQAKEGLAIAERGVEQALRTDEELTAEYNQVESDYNRSSKLFQEGIHSRKEFDQAKTAYLKVKAQLELTKQKVYSARAALRQAQQVVHEAQIYADYARIHASDSGTVTSRNIEPGDLATPAATLLTIQTGSTLRLEAGVRESLIGKIHIGMPLQVKIGSNDQLLTGHVEEIEPYANAKTRSFLVKVGIPATPGIFPGMFGRLLIPLASRNTILIPKAALTSIGQLQTVTIATESKERKVFVRTGREYEDKIEILSGLQDGDSLIF